MTRDNEDTPSDPRIDLILTIAGVVCIFALIGFFAIEQMNPGTHVLPDRTVVVMLGIIAGLLGIKTILPGTDYRPDGGVVELNGTNGEEDQ